MEFEETIEPISRQSLAKQVAAEIQNLILTNKMQPGTRLPSERRLSELFGVSRIVVREAFKTLQERGLLEVRTGQGAFVSELGSSSISEALTIYLTQQKGDSSHLREVRNVLETAIAAAAAERATAEDLVRMHENLEEQRVLVERIPSEGLAGSAFEKWVQADVLFHYELALASKNPLFALLIATLNDLMVEVRYKASRDLSAVQTGLEHHRLIYKAVLSRNPASARERMARHLEHVGIMAALPQDSVETSG